MVRRPSISIITPTYNRGQVLARAIRSVQQQTFADYEHIIVDDGSDDATEQVVRQFNDVRIRYCRCSQRQGANAARNTGIDMARGEWLTFLDSDDAYLPHRLNTTTRAIRSAECDLLLSSFMTMKRGRKRPALNPEIFLSPGELEEALVTHGIFIAGSSITVRRRTLLSAGGFDPAIARMQDRDVLLRLACETGARLLAKADWVKYPSADSISGARSGYVAGLAALFDAHPRLCQRYRNVIGYLLARRALSDFLGCRFGQAIRTLRENSNSQVLQFGALELIGSYFAGSSQRRALVRALNERPHPDCVILPIEAWRRNESVEATHLARAA